MPGIGPGQFQSLGGLASSADTVFVWDLELSRVSAFDTTGTLIYTRRAEPLEDGVPVDAAWAGPGEWLVLDTDVLIEKPVQFVFRKYAFDIGVSKRNWDHLKPAAGFTGRMPYNTGVLFSRCPHFFGEAYTRPRNLSNEEQHWMGEQTVMNEILNEERPRYKIRFMNGNVFNFPPPVKDPGAKEQFRETLKQVHITHYKGEKRKAMLMERLACA